MPAQRNDTGSQPVQRVPFGRVSAAPVAAEDRGRPRLQAETKLRARRELNELARPTEEFGSYDEHEDRKESLMLSAPFRVVLGTCVLYSMHLRDVLLQAAAEGTPHSHLDCEARLGDDLPRCVPNPFRATVAASARSRWADHPGGMQCQTGPIDSLSAGHDHEARR